MAGIVERLGSMASTDMGQVLGLAHSTYTERMQVHNHTGLAILETIGHVAKTHPAIFGIAALFLIEVVLEEQKILHNQHVAAAGGGSGAAATAVAAPHAAGGLHFPHLEAPHLTAPQLHAPKLNLDHIKPGKVALEVFGALILLKFATFGARMFRRKTQPDVWFGPASRIHLFSGTLGAYYVAKSLRSPKLSAWRNAAAALFVTDALKPVLKAPKGRKGVVAPAPALRTTAVAAAPLVATPFTSGPAPAAPPPAAPVSPVSGPAGGSPAPGDGGRPTAQDGADAANDPTSPAAPAFAAAPQFWTPPPRPLREATPVAAPPVASPPVASPPAAAPQLVEAAGPEHAAPAGMEPAAPQLAAPALSGEIIQWTGFTSASDTASRLID